MENLLVRKGKGGSSIVLRARQLKPVPRDVAIKVIDAKDLQGSARQRFEMEREALATLNHPHIAVIHTGRALILTSLTTGTTRPFGVSTAIPMLMYFLRSIVGGMEKKSIVFQSL